MKLITVCRSGGIYTREWADRIAAHTPDGWEFICLDDSRLDHGWPGWWSKIEAFRIKGPAVYLDLDTVVTGDLRRLDMGSGFWMVSDFYNPKVANSSAMYWSGNVSIVYDAFRNDADALMARYDAMQARIGDQAFIEDVLTPNRFPDGLVVSYKKHARKGPPAGAVAVTFHGRPKPHEAGGWVQWT